MCSKVSFDLSLQIRRIFQAIPSKDISRTQQSQILIPARVRNSITVASRACHQPFGRVRQNTLTPQPLLHQSIDKEKFWRVASRACCKLQGKAETVASRACCKLQGKAETVASRACCKLQGKAETVASRACCKLPKKVKSLASRACCKLQGKAETVASRACCKLQKKVMSLASKRACCKLQKKVRV